MFGRGRKIVPQMGRTAGAQAQLPTAIGAKLIQMPFGAGSAKRAFKRTNVSPLRIGRQGSITTFTIWAHFQHHDSSYGFEHNLIVMPLCVYSSACMSWHKKIQAASSGL
jgi:hypothetical protein